MQLKKNRYLEWMEFDLFSSIPSLRHGIFLRQLSDFSKPFASLIQEQFNHETILYPKQTHSAMVEEASSDQITVSCDGLTTQKTAVGLAILHADCQAALFYDPINQAIAAVHAGWRGSKENIYQKMIDKMSLLFGTKAKDLMVGISPSLGPCCAEFVHYKSELPSSFHSFQPKPFHFDFWEISRSQLINANVLPSNIEISAICTQCSSYLFHSYRRNKSPQRQITIICIC